MNAASRVRITKIKVRKDKHGEKFAAIELIRVVDESDRYDGRLKQAIEQMLANPAMAMLRLSEKVTSQNLTFFAAAGIDKASELVPGVALEKFKLKRYPGETKTRLILSYEFEIGLGHARQWLIPSIGDDVLCTIDDAQLSFPKE